MAARYVGQSIPRLDARGKVTGATLFPGDHNFEHELWLKVLFAGRPHARIRRIDTGRAEALPGVHLVLTARDVPRNEYGLQINDQPVLCGPGSDKEGADVVRFVGDQVALVVAETEEIAAQARDLIEIEWEDLPLVPIPNRPGSRRRARPSSTPTPRTTSPSTSGCATGTSTPPGPGATSSWRGSTRRLFRSTPSCNPKPAWPTSMRRAG